MSKSINERRTEVLDELAKLSEQEIKSLAIKESDLPIVMEILERKKKMTFMPCNGEDLMRVVSRLIDEDEVYRAVAEELSPKERQYIKSILEEACCLNCTNGSCRVPSNEKMGVDEKNIPVGHFCLGWENDILMGKCKVLGK